MGILQTVVQYLVFYLIKTVSSTSARTLQRESTVSSTSTLIFKKLRQLSCVIGIPLFIIHYTSREFLNLFSLHIWKAKSMDKFYLSYVIYAKHFLTINIISNVLLRFAMKHT